VYIIIIVCNKWYVFAVMNDKYLNNKHQ